MKNPPLVTIRKTSKQLKQKQLCVARVQAARMLVQVLRQVRVLKLYTAEKKPGADPIDKI